jgi:glycosyltransferase involved in cell wall biosynthesis
MTAAADPRTGTTHHASAQRRFEFDSVYFLMFDGWKQELMSNRWHFAARWARHLPVVLLQPNQHAPRAANEPEPRLPNTEIVSVQATREPTHLGDALIQAGQVHNHMRWRGHTRPLLWCYNPNLAGMYAAVPAVARVYHATENYFHFDGLSSRFLDSMRAAITVSDVIVAVSDGVAASLRDETGRTDIAVVTNGCDRAFYGGDAGDDELASYRKRYQRIAVYGGNINSRLDFDLIRAIADAYPSTLLAFYGPVMLQKKRDRDGWAEARGRSNVHHFGPVPTSRLPALYRTADLGFIPYTRDPWIVENGFPLKVLEMGATGLPVVSTYMKAIAGLADALVVASTDEEFVDAFGTVERQRLAPDAIAELEALCEANDYDAKFDTIAALVANATAGREGALTTKLDEAIPYLGETAWLDACSAYSAASAAPYALERLRRSAVYMVRVVLGRPLAAAARTLPRGAIEWLPKRVRDKVWETFVG